MNSIFPISKNFSNNLRISHIKVPEFQINRNGTEIIKAKKIQVNPLKSQSRSESTRCNFRRVFQIPRSGLNKENTPENMQKNKQKSEDSVRHKSLCRGNKLIDAKIEKSLNDSFVSRRKTNDMRIVPKIRLMNVTVETNGNFKKGQDDLVTFRPDVTPSKKESRFPRDVFCIDSKRRTAN